MPKKSNRITENRLIKVVEPAEPNGLYIIYCQAFRGKLPVGLPWQAHLNKEDYTVLTMKWILLSEFKVPEHFIDKFIDAVRDAKERDDIDSDVYED
jgi:hypothetical protein